jgi:hypothetical protein
MLLLLRPGVGRRRAGSSLASTTPSSALCGPPSGIRLRPVPAARPGGDGRTDYQICCCCLARPAPAARPGGDGWTDYQTGICCLSPQNVFTRILWAVV